MIARRLFVLGFAVALPVAFGCSGGGGGGVSTTGPALACSDGGAAGSNSVGMTCAGATDASTAQINVSLGGPASGATTLRGVNFDVTYDASKLEFVPAPSYTSALFPGALIAVTLLNNQQGRVVVSIQQPGALPDVLVTAGQHVVLVLSFRTVTGATFGPTSPTFENALATSASATITFTSGLALSYQ
jgi:hypothetical protein